MVWSTVCASLSSLWLSKEDTIAVVYCVPAKTLAMGVPLATVMFVGLPPITSSKLQIPMVIYQGLQIAAGSLLTIVFRKWLDRKDNSLKSEESTPTPAVDPAGQTQHLYNVLVFERVMSF